MNENENKGTRLLDMYDRLSHGEILSKQALADAYGVTTKTIQRDIDELRAHLSETALRGADAGRSSTTGERGDIDWYILPMST